MSNQDLLTLIPECSHLITLPLSKKEIKVEPFKHGSMKNILLIMKDIDKVKKGGTKKMLSALNDVLQKCVKEDSTGEKIDIRKLHVADYIYMMLYIREISKGEETQFTYCCREKECRHEKDLVFKLDDCELFNEDKKETEKIKIEFDEENYIIFHVNSFSFNVLFQNAGMFGSEIETGDETTNYYCSFIECIESKDGNLYDNLSLSQKRMFLEKMTNIQLKPLIDHIEKQPMLKWKKVFECEKCGVENHAIMDNIMHFFSIS